MRAKDLQPNIPKGLDLGDRLTEEPWMEVCNIIQQAVTKIILMERKWKKAKGLSEEALQMAKKTRETKGKGERERYTQLNAEFQRRARRDQKGFLNEQGKETEETNRMGKTRDLFRKNGDSKRKFHARMGTKKD